MKIFLQCRIKKVFIATMSKNKMKILIKVVVWREVIIQRVQIMLRKRNRKIVN